MEYMTNKNEQVLNEAHLKKLSNARHQGDGVGYRSYSAGDRGGVGVGGRACVSSRLGLGRRGRPCEATKEGGGR
jgi:hypothetical protein